MMVMMDTAFAVQAYKQNLQAFKAEEAVAV